MDEANSRRCEHRCLSTRDGGGSRRRGGERLEMVGKGLASVGGRALVALALVGVCCGQTFKIYQGGTAKWYDAFNERYDAGFLGTSYCEGKKPAGLGAAKCESNRGCCYVPPESESRPDTEKCVACQEIRGTWQGVLGTCVHQDIPTVVDFNTQQNRDNPTKTSTRCVPTVVDPTILVFEESSGKMATGVSPSSAPSNGGQFAFDFQYSREEASGHVDMFISTFLGSRTIFGKFAVEQSELGSTLFLALGSTRASTSAPQRTSALLREEVEHVYFEGFRVADFSPAVETYAAQRLPAGSCRHVAVPGDDMDAIARRYLLTWQEIYAFNAHVYDPQSIKPGDQLAVGRHHVVKGPCTNFEERQSGPMNTDVVKDVTCTCTSQEACRAAEGAQLGETLFGIATRLGTSWQRVVDMNPQLQACTATSCAVLPGDSLCVVPYLRNVMCSAEYRRFPVVDTNGNSPGYLNTYFSCDTKWTAKLSVEKCCQVPRCKCCTKDKYAGVGTAYTSFQDAPTANTCDVTAVPHQKCLQDPLLTSAQGVTTYSLLCDDDCQLLCDKEDPTTPDPTCPTAIGLTIYTGLCVSKRMLNGLTLKVCS